MRVLLNDPHRSWILTLSLVLAFFTPPFPAEAAEASSFVVSTNPEEIVLFVGVTSFTAGETRSATVYGDGRAVLHVDTEKEVRKEVSQKIDRKELEMVLQRAVASALPNWDSEGLGRRASALGSRLAATESATRTRVLFAFEILAHGGATERQIAPSFALYDSRALAAAFPEISEYSAVVQLEDWMESLWKRPPPVSSALRSNPFALGMPEGGSDLVLHVQSRSVQSPRQTELRFFGDGGVLLETKQSGEILKSRRGRLAPAELAELQEILRRLVNFDPRAVAVQIFRKTGKSVFNPSSDVGPQSFEIRLRGADSNPVIRRFDYASGGAGRRFPSIQELGDLKRVWDLAYQAVGRK